MRSRPILLFLALLLVASSSAWAKPHKGFHTGPYLALEIGLSHNAFDKNIRENRNIGTLIEPTIGFLFGWNALDWLSAELEARYITSEKDDRREHIGGANLNAKFFLITDALTDFKTLRILPFGKVGAAFHVAVLPGDMAASDSTVTSFAYGPSVGGGVMFLFAKYVYLGLNVQGDFLFFDDIRQDITVGGTTTSELIYKGGLTPQFVATAILGVHF